MSIAVTENRASSNALAASLSWSDRQAAEERSMAQTVLEASKKPLHLPALFAARNHRNEQPTVAQVLADALDYEDFNARLLQILCDVAHGKGDRQADAAELLDDMARKWASFNTEQVE